MSCRRFALTAISLVLLCTSFARGQGKPAAPDPADDANSEKRASEQAATRRRAAARDADIRVPDNVQLVRDVVYAKAPVEGDTIVELKMDAAFLKQSNGKPMPAIVYIHGGGWSGGSRQMGLRPSIALALGGYFACTIDYRLSGAAKYPAAVHDCKAAIRFLRANAEDLGIDPNRIGVWGHSAGGHLSALIGTTGNTHDFDGEVGSVPKDTSSAVQCVVDYSGPIDLTNVQDGSKETGPVAMWLGGAVRTHEDLARKASPTTYVDANDPPTLIIHGTDDKIVNIKHSELFAKSLKDAGVTVEFVRAESNGHVVSDPDTYRRTAEWFDEHLGGHAAGAVGQLVEQIGETMRSGGRDAQSRPSQRRQPASTKDAGAENGPAR